MTWPLRRKTAGAEAWRNAGTVRRRLTEPFARIVGRRMSIWSGRCVSSWVRCFVRLWMLMAVPGVRCGPCSILLASPNLRRSPLDCEHPGEPIAETRSSVPTRNNHCRSVRSLTYRLGPADRSAARMQRGSLSRAACEPIGRRPESERSTRSLASTSLVVVFVVVPL